MIRTKLSGRCVMLAIAFSGTVPIVRATTLLDFPIGNFSYSEDFSNFGKQRNRSCPALGGGICAATSEINSLIFLENQYPGVYGNKLTPGIQGAKPNQTDPSDTLLFGALYYGSTKGAYSAFVDAENQWFNTFAPGTTYLESNYPGSPEYNGLPTLGFLASQIQQKEDVELFVFGGGIGHAIDLTAITCTASGCVIKYQDPNEPKFQQTSQLFYGPRGSLIFQGLPGTDPKYTQTFFTIGAAFGESPVPEPSSWILFGTGIAGLVVIRKMRVNG
jgi:hypothetical protein